jgi:hypothetical protein
MGAADLIHKDLADIWIEAVVARGPGAAALIGSRLDAIARARGEA